MMKREGPTKSEDSRRRTREKEKSVKTKFLKECAKRERGGVGVYADRPCGVQGSN